MHADKEGNEGGDSYLVLQLRRHQVRGTVSHSCWGTCCPQSVQRVALQHHLGTQSLGGTSPGFSGSLLLGKLPGAERAASQGHALPLGSPHPMARGPRAIKTCPFTLKSHPNFRTACGVGTSPQDRAAALLLPVPDPAPSPFCCGR